MTVKVREEWRELVPPGVRFNPTEKELIEYYLKPKVNEDPSLPKGMISELNVYEHNPRQLKELAIRYDDNKTYIFSQVKRSATGRTRRMAKDGGWKGQSALKQVKMDGKHVGYRTELAWYWTEKGCRDRYIMKEYVLRIGDNLALCLMYQTNENDFVTEPQTNNNGVEIAVTEPQTNNNGVEIAVTEPQTNNNGVDIAVTEQETNNSGVDIAVSSTKLPDLNLSPPS